MTTVSTYEDFEQWDKVLELVKADNKKIHDIEFWFLFSCCTSYLIDKKQGQFILADTLIKYCVEAGRKPTNIPQAACVGDTNLIREFLDSGHDIDETEFRGATSLMIAVLSENITMVKFLLQNGGSNYSEDIDNNKAIDYAKKDTEIFNLLKSSGIQTREEMNETMEDYYSAVEFSNDFRDTQIEFMTGAEKGNIVQMEMALSRPKGIWILNGTYPVNGRTALHLAVEKNKIEAVSFLIAKGLDKNKPDLSGETPVKLAKRLKFSEIEKVLNANL